MSTMYLVFNDVGNFNSCTTNLAFLQAYNFSSGFIYVEAPEVWDEYTTYINGEFIQNDPPIKT